MIEQHRLRHCAAILPALALALCLGACSGQDASQQQGSQQEPAAAASTTALADGTYDISAETDSSMFRSETCTLTVKDGSYTAELALPGEGFTKLYFGSAEDAAKAADADIYEYHVNDAGKYCFDIPVAELDKEIQVAAYGHRKDKWYDHTITFHAPEATAVSDAA